MLILSEETGDGKNKKNCPGNIMIPPFLFT